MPERQSAIADAAAKGGRDGADGRRRLKLGEQRGWSLIQLAAFASTLEQLEQAAVPRWAALCRQAWAKLSARARASC